MPIETRHFDAITARAQCAAGKFKLCGRTLAPLSFRHILQLEAYECALWIEDRDPEISDFLLAAHICSNADFIASLPIPTDDDCIMFDLADALETWRAYIAQCFQSAPRTWKFAGQMRPHCRAPLEEFVVSFILRNANGFTRDGLYTMPAGEVFWIFESIMEQVGNRSWIISQEDAEDMERESTPEAQRSAKQREKVAGQIFRLVPDTKPRIALLAALDAGTLPRDWAKPFTRRARRGQK